MRLTTSSNFFPPATAETETETKATDELEYDTEEEQDGVQGTEATTEILSQLPDAPTDEPVDVDHAEQPSQKKQKTEEGSDDNFVVIDKEGEDSTKPKSELW